MREPLGAGLLQEGIRDLAMPLPWMEEHAAMMYLIVPYGWGIALILAEGRSA